MPGSSKRLSLKPPLHQSVAGLIVLICLTLLALDGWRGLHARNVALKADKTATANLAGSLARHAHDLILSADLVLSDLADRMPAANTDPATLANIRRLMLTNVARLPVLHGLFIYGADGNAVVTTAAPGATTPNVADRAYFQFHRVNPKPGVHIGDPVESRSDGTWAMTVSRRLDGPDGSFAGVAVAGITIDNLDRFYAQFNIGHAGVISLVMTDGRVVARNPFTAAPDGMPISANEPPRQTPPQLPFGPFRYVGAADGIQRLGSYHVVDKYPLYVMVAHGQDDVLANWRADARNQLAVTLCILLAFGFLGSRLVRQIRSRQLAERQYRLLADHSNDAIVCIALDGRQVFISPSFTTLTGWSMTESLGHNWTSFVIGADQATLAEALGRLRGGETSLSLSYRTLRRDGSPLWVEARCHLVPADAGEQPQFVANIRDISERKAADEELEALHRVLEEQANTDSLTGLANRRRFSEALAQEWLRAAREQAPLSLLLLDVDHFKQFNDRYGHLAGDACLCRIAEAILPLGRRSGDLTARYGGEEFAILLPGATAEGAREVACLMRAAIEALMIGHESNTPLPVATASFGVATLYPQHPTRPDGMAELIALADAALYDAKRSGRNRVIHHADSMLRVGTQLVARPIG